MTTPQRVISLPNALSLLKKLLMSSLISLAGTSCLQS